MDINQLSQIVKKKILDNKFIQDVQLEDKSFLHKNHKNNNPNKFHLKLNIKSEILKKMSRIESNKLIFKILDQEMKNYIHSLQILLANSEIRNFLIYLINLKISFNFTKFFISIKLILFELFFLSDLINLIILSKSFFLNKF